MADYTFVVDPAASVVYMSTELNLQGVQHDAITSRDDGVTVEMTVHGLDAADEPAVDQHVTGAQVDFAKLAKLDDVSRRTTVLVNGGFWHRAVQFTLVLDNRSNYIGIKVMQPFPIKIQNTDQTDTLLIANSSEHDAFLVDGLQRYKYIKDGESDLIDEIRTASTVTDVYAITDNRT